MFSSSAVKISSRSTGDTTESQGCLFRIVEIGEICWCKSEILSAGSELDFESLLELTSVFKNLRYEEIL